MDPGDEVTFPEALAQSLRDAFAAEFGRIEAELDAVAVNLGVLPVPHCRVYWGSHGCKEPRGHAPEVPHACDCCECENHPDPDPGNPGCKPSCVAMPPYYGPGTLFYGEEAEALGLPLVDPGSAPGSNGRRLG